MLSNPHAQTVQQSTATLGTAMWWILGVKLTLPLLTGVLFSIAQFFLPVKWKIRPHLSIICTSRRLGLVSHQ